MSKHLASYALMGSVRRRLGTRFVYKHEDISQAIGQPYFKWRNSEMYRAHQQWLASRRAGLTPESSHG